MRSLVSHLLLALPMLFILTGLVIYLMLQKKTRVSLKIIYALLFFSVVISTPFFPNLLVKSMENRYHIFSDEKLSYQSNSVHILVLGGGHTYDERLPSNIQLSDQAMVRLSEGIRIHRMLPGSKLVTSGYGLPGELTQAEIMRKTAILLGVDSMAVLMQKKPENTWMEATEYKRLFSDTTQLIIVTSALHMPRAVYLFEKAGLNPAAAPTGFKIKQNKKFNFWFWIPSSGNIAKTEDLMHEIFGIVWAWLAYKS